MPTFTTGDPCWIDLMTDSIERSHAFYGQLFGWTFTDSGAEFGHYNMITLDDAPIGGAMENSAAAAGMPPEMADIAIGNYWSTYLHTADIDALAHRAVDHGTQVLGGDPMQVGELGWSLEVLNPALGMIGAWQPLEFPGTGLLAAAGAPCWFELHTSHFPEAVSLMRDVFEWDAAVTADTPQFRYAEHRSPEGATAGIYDVTRTGPGTDEDAGVAAPGESSEGSGGPEPAHWVVYFGTPDVDAAASRVIELGGSVLLGPHDSPYGRMAAVADDQGTTFSLVQADAVS